MANSRIKDIAPTAAAAASDDYLVIDGATNGTRKIAASNVGGGGGEEYDFQSSLTPAIDGRGTTVSIYNIVPTDATSRTVSNALKIRAYLAGSNNVYYPLIVTSVTLGSTAIYIDVKSIYYNVQSTTASSVTGTLHVIAPFEISSVSASM